MSLTITTNNVPRLILEPYELTPAERADFEYLDWDALERGEDSASFFRYKGTAYDLGDLERVEPQQLEQFTGWDGYVSETFFSGIVVRYCPDDDDRVIVGRYYA